jgi:hypothetical protein
MGTRLFLRLFKRRSSASSTDIFSSRAQSVVVDGIERRMMVVRNKGAVGHVRA